LYEQWFMNMIKDLYQVFLKHPFVSTDTRKIQAGSIFFGIRGPNFNGSDFADEALEKGAVYAVVDSPVKSDNKRIFRVEDTLVTLQKLAQYHRATIKTRIFAITGSNGKTTTKELCHAVLNRKFKVSSTAGNLNNHIGVPLTLLALTHETEIGIVEMGANHPGEIAALCDIALPDYGLITNIGKAHLEGFGTIEGVKKTKGELFEFLMNQHNTLFVNENDPEVKSLLSREYTNCVSYNNKFCNGTLLSADPFLNLNVRIAGHEFFIKTRLIGKYNIENVLAAVAVGNHFGVTDENIKLAIEDYQPDNYRSQFIDSGRNIIVMDAYNANPSSMRLALDNFLEMKGEKKLMIIGQMLELGDNSPAEHQKIIDYLANRQSGDVIFIGDYFAEAARVSHFRYYRTVEDLIKEIDTDEFHSRLILIKGSRGNKLEKLLSFL
jgi:UDP-N-acetylmuramoyl-tripeptide--D-alanyl-D-alanine ligase